jgi:hypothetical protein
LNCQNGSKSKDLKLLEENIGKTLQNTGIDNTFLNRTPVTQEIRARIDKRNCIKLSFCTAKETISTVKRQPTEWEKIFVSYHSDPGLISRMYKEHKTLKTKRTSNPINKWTNELVHSSFQMKYKWPINA